MAQDKLAARVRSRGQRLSPALRRVGEFIDENRLQAMTKSAAELAAAIGTSDATVIRAVKALGYAGLPELRRELVAFFGKAATPADNLMRTLSEIDQNSRHPIDTVLMDHAAALAMLQTPEARAQLANAVEELGKASRVAVFGIGPSRYLAEYMCFSLRRFGLSAYALTAAGASMADQLLDLCPGDALIMLAYGRSYREAEVVLSEAVRLKVPSVLITDSYDERLTRNAKTLVRVPRGRKDHVAMHGATLVALEAVLMALAAVARSRALVQLDRLNELRGALRVPAREARR